jgi:hypothetical protein
MGVVSGALPHSQPPNPQIVGMRLPGQGRCNHPTWLYDIQWISSPKVLQLPNAKYKTLAEFFNDLQKPRKSQVEAVRRIILRAESNLIN